MMSSNRESTVEFLSNRSSFFDESDYHQSGMIREEVSMLSESMRSNSQVPMSDHYTVAKETVSGAEQIYALTDQIEACVWDNIRLTHINAKLLDYAKRQAVDS